MFLLERNALVTIAPGYAHDKNNVGEYRWQMNVSLPYPFPSKTCVKHTAIIDGREYEVGIHNHFDRMFVVPKSQPGMPRASLIEKRSQPQISNDVLAHREILQSVAVFAETRIASSANAAFEDASKKITECLRYLSRFLGECQRNCPYLTAWLVYPFSAFEVGTIFHDVQHRVKPEDNWHVCGSTVAISMARHLQQPLFLIDPSQAHPSVPVMDAANELLAEALMSLFRGMPRLTVMNSYAAVEMLAKTILETKCASNLEARGTPKDVAAEMSKERIHGKRMDSSWLFHSQMRRECGRSLNDEFKAEYDRLLELQRVRNDVAHNGYKPTDDEAREGHKTACEVARWLADIGGFRIKPMLPKQEDTLRQINVISADAFGRSSHEIELIRRLFGIAANTKCPVQQTDISA